MIEILPVAAMIGKSEMAKCSRVMYWSHELGFAQYPASAILANFSRVYICIRLYLFWWIRKRCVVCTHRSLYTWKSVSSLRAEFFLQDESSFESNPVTKPVVTQATTRHQMKDMDIIFSLIPLNFPWVMKF